MAEIRMGSTVTLAYTVKTEDGGWIDAACTEKPLVFTVGESDIIPGMIHNAIGMKKGEKKSFRVDPPDAYGERNPLFVRALPRKLFPDSLDIIPGDVLSASTRDGQKLPLTVLEVGTDTVTVDFNHPLAGKALFFDIEIIDVKDGVPSVGDE